jgi:isopropylmalate/homocitrate/citramalate synthase
MANNKKILVIDETLREGMQFHGIVFTLEQRIKILEFQERLGVAVSQTGYPSALAGEAKIVKALAVHARNHKFNIRTAALGRTVSSDTRILIDTGVDDPHFHIHLTPDTPGPELLAGLKEACALFNLVVDERPGARVSLAMLNMARTDPLMLDQCIEIMDQCPGLSILSLPDTSGIMAPNQVQDFIAGAVKKTRRLTLAAHCHNDMGMASANSIMGIIGGARALEVSALGIGERNGIADLYTTASHLAGQGYDTGLDLDNMEGFKAYYAYVNEIVRSQTGINLMDYRCPVFGDAVKTHVAGTHAVGGFGTATEEEFFLSLLCGRHLVRKYLTAHNIPWQTEDLGRITKEVKEASLNRGRALRTDEVKAIAAGG